MSSPSATATAAAWTAWPRSSGPPASSRPARPAPSISGSRPPPGPRPQARSEDRDGAWILAEALADAAGMLVSPGEFYGPAGAGHVRIAVVQPDDRIELVARRLAESSDPRLGRRRPTT